MPKKVLPVSGDEFEDRKEQFFTALRLETDRGCALVAAALIDERLEMVLRAVMVADPETARRVVNPLFAVQGPLGSLWSKIQVAFALGLLSERTYRDLEIVREIRNKFAHQYGPAGFDDPEVVALASQLKHADDVVSSPHFQLRRSSASTEEERKTDVTRTGMPAKMERARFTFTVAWIAASLEAAVRHTAWMDTDARLSALRHSTKAEGKKEA